MSRNMRAADMRPADMRPADMRTHPTAAAVSAKAVSAAVSAKAMAAAVAAAAMPAAVSAAAVPAATVSAATAARVCFECEKRHDEEQHRGQASAGRQRQPHGAAGLGAPNRWGRLSPGILQRTKSF
jgi:hypothetical protein